jgi:hypothetical protein
MFKRGWQDGNAQIVARQTHEGTYRKGINVWAPTGQYHHVYDYVADVTPDGGGSVFRGTFVEMFESDTERRPLPGETARVKFDPKSQEVKFDRNVLYEEAKASKAAEDSSFAAIASAAPGTVPAEAPPTHVPVEAEGVSGADSVLIASILIAKRKGDLAEVERLKGVLIDRGIPIPKSV